ncbi:MAG: glycosyltransferase family 2 protein [Lachnospiraceae bacterium]|nr:glycosyltransferase family 2 protein [Lachnospiraceae bacterium]
MEKLLTIGITSYNRTKELKRCLESIETKFPEKIEILVSEDKSPLRNEIEMLVSEFANKTEFQVRFNSNQYNLGYDRNLKKIINLAEGQYVFYMSDDDVLYPYAIDKTICILEKEKHAMVYAPFYLAISKEMRRAYNKSYVINNNLRYVAKHVYDSILFSGLVFRRDLVVGLDAEPFLNKNYFQVYMFLYCISKFGGYYMSKPTVCAMGDGENAYGHSDSSEKNKLLADRTSVFSNLEFHKGLIFVIKKFDEDYHMNIFGEFEKEYNLRSIVGMSNAEANGKKTLKRYWSKMNSLNVRINAISRIYYIMLMVFGKNVTLNILKIPKRVLLRSRNETQ